MTTATVDESCGLVKTSPSSRQQQQSSLLTRRRRKATAHGMQQYLSPRKCPPTSTLATALSACVLISYALCIIGVVVVLDAYNHQRQSGRYLNAEASDNRISPSRVTDNGKSGNGGESSSILRRHSNNKDDDVQDAEGREIDGGNGMVDLIVVPSAKWPVTALQQNSDGNDINVDEYEYIAHPVLEQIKLRVPKFWSPPVHDDELMTRELAMRIGTCTVPNSRGGYARGADCPLHQRTIFLMIASYRDYQCRETVEDLYNRAEYPERIRVAVVDQLLHNETELRPCNEPLVPCEEDPEQALCLYQHLIDVIRLDARLSVGPVPARHIGYRMYRGEYYAFQSDAHVSFVNRWDVTLILAHESTGNEMAVLSTYLADFTDAMDDEGNSKMHSRPIMCNSRWQSSQGAYHIHHSVQPLSRPAIVGMPQLHPWWAAGFSFARGHFVVNVPYDWYQPMVFSGEEMSIAIRGFTIGYDFFAPEQNGKPVCFLFVLFS